MKKILLFCFFTLLFFTSCQTSVDLKYMVPSRVDMGPYRNIAVASVTPDRGFSRPSVFIRTSDRESGRMYSKIYSSYSSNLAYSVADYATSELVRQLEESRYFSVISPRETDHIIKYSYNPGENLSALGADAVLLSSIDTMYINEYIHSKSKERIVTTEDGKEIVVVDTYYYYSVSCNLKFSYTLVDSRTNKVIFSDSFSRTFSDDAEIPGPWFSAPSPLYSYNNMVRGIIKSMVFDFVPHTVTSSISLMKNKPENESAELAYDLAKDGKYLSAADHFYSVFSSSSHIPSAYNAALLYAASDISKALEVLDEAYEKTGSGEILELKNTFLRMQKSTEEAHNQIEGKSPGEQGISSYNIYRMYI